jgi:hypothetical protein
MAPCIFRTKNVVLSLMEYFKSISKKPLFGVVAYKDHGPDEEYVTKIKDLSEG